MTVHVILSDEDAATVKAILLTHAEIQDSRVLPSMELFARLSRDEPGEVDMLEQLEEQLEILEDDSIDLRRLAQLF